MGKNYLRSFLKKIKELKENKDIDLIIIMGTSLKVFPFASIPNLFDENVYKLVINMDKVGDFSFDKILAKSVFIQGKTDENVIKFLKDCNLYQEFEDFIKKEYNENIDDLMRNELNDKKDDDIDEIIKNIKNNMNLDDYK
jgi:NAD-dependent SIR2 family protein deacetylase